MARTLGKLVLLSAILMSTWACTDRKTSVTCLKKANKGKCTKSKHVRETKCPSTCGFCQPKHLPRSNSSCGCTAWQDFADVMPVYVCMRRVDGDSKAVLCSKASGVPPLCPIDSELCHASHDDSMAAQSQPPIPRPLLPASPLSSTLPSSLLRSLRSPHVLAWEPSSPPARLLQSASSRKAHEGRHLAARAYFYG